RWRELSFGIFAVVVEALPGLPAQPTRFDHVVDQWCGLEAIAVTFFECREDVVEGVETVEVTELERAHGMVEPQAHRLVDVLDGTQAGFEYPDALEPQGRRDPAGQESGAVLAAYVHFTIETLGERACPGEGVVSCLQPSDEFDQTHHHRRVEEVDPDEVSSALLTDASRQRGDAELRGVRADEAVFGSVVLD